MDVTEGGVKRRERRPALARAADENEGQWGVTAAHVAQRLSVQRRLDEGGDERRVVPPSGVHREYAWEKPDRLWEGTTGAGYTEVLSDSLRADPVARLLMRYDEMECGGAVRAVGGTRVAMDEAEVRVMRGKSSGAATGTAGAMQACRAVSDVAMGLHMVLQFTDA